MKGSTKYNLALYSMVLLPLIQVIVFHYIPMFGTVIAFKNYRFNKGILGSDWVGFKNFEFFLKSNDFLEVTRNTLGNNFLFIVTGVFCSVALAILLYNITSRKTIKVLQTFLITPHFVGWVLVAYIVFAILSPGNGVLNNFLTSIGLEEINWYAEAEYWPVILMIVNLWKHVGMDCIVYYAALMGIDETLFEAARIDGASKWDIVKNIMIPELASLILMLTILKIGNIFRGDFGLFYQVTMNAPLLYETTDVVDTYLFRTMQETNNMSLSAAIGLLQSVVGFFLVIFTNWLSKKIDPDAGLF